MPDHRANKINDGLVFASLENGLGANTAIRETSGQTGLFGQTVSEDIDFYTTAQKCNKPAYRLQKHRRGYLSASYGLDQLFNRVWLRPVLFDLGFIVEELNREVKIWNAWLERSIIFSAVFISREAGTNFDYPSLPHDIVASDSLVLDLTIEKDGPPMQDTEYRLTLDGLLYDFYIEGMRIIPINPDIEWDKSPAMTYGFQTVLYQEPTRFKEQRRALIEFPDREQKVSYLLQNNEAHRFFNLFSYGHDKVFGVPIYNEKMIPSTLNIGSTTIQLVTSTNYLYNLKNNCTFIIIIDHDNSLSEIKKIDSISANEIEVSTTIVTTFNLNSTFVYPVLMSMIQATNFEEETDNIQICTVDFKEYIS